MMSSTQLRAIPWAHESGDLGAVWIWSTPHFEVIVNGNVRSCYYRISDKSEGKAKPFADGQAGTFEEAEMLIRETIGKSYPVDLGYAPYAGYLATTFPTATGRKVDFAEYIGRAVNVTVLQPDGTRQYYTGVLQISHYHIELRTGKVNLKIIPTYIESIVPEIDSTIRQRDTKLYGRTYKGRITPGCTGKPGIAEETIEHSGIACPVHE